MKKVPPSVQLEQGFYERLATSADPLGEAARQGAQLMLQKALEAEVDGRVARTFVRVSGSLSFQPQR